MLPLLRTDRRLSKCIVTHGPLPPFVDPKQPPTKKKPFSTVTSLTWYHNLSLILPAELLETIMQELEDPKQTPLGRTLKYAKVMMKLGDIIAGEFFDMYIKKGNILMLSEGRPGIDNVFELHEGVLRMELDKATYERVGLVGTSIQDLGRKHTKSRYRIEIDLRQPSMLHGKKGFERVVWAFKNVLNHTMTWLFYDCTLGRDMEEAAPIDKHCPKWVESQPEVHHLPSVPIPQITTATVAAAMDKSNQDDTSIADIEEWLSLIALSSPRVQSTETIDPFLCRYDIPMRLDLPSDGAPEPVAKEAGVALAVLSWNGFLPHTFVMGTLLRVLKPRLGSHVTALQAHTFRGACVTVMKVPQEGVLTGGGEYLFWEHAALV